MHMCIIYGKKHGELKHTIFEQRSHVWKWQTVLFRGDFTTSKKILQIFYLRPTRHECDQACQIESDSSITAKLRYYCLARIVLIFTIKHLLTQWLYCHLATSSYKGRF
ncbi:hypothetical protein QUB80_20045 [Chlorogloeopsis sp. ULAP01]|uniref:hypothetical protein n=1 Tax=Chlorogloeopsis sp. ULAP01 TaxID=3056483 RepID=UPI0025AB14BE|nr:hypothetical protein [Chlorogloeopsis sp. ULAP01]MDM9382990.1 hypothetical protein [Chlorogloeopsis sp. ULAP01]